MHYLNSPTNEILASCFQDYKDKKSCGKVQCDAVRPFIQRLASCNCYHRHGDIVPRRSNCAGTSVIEISLKKLNKKSGLPIGSQIRFLDWYCKTSYLNALDFFKQVQIPCHPPLNQYYN